MAKGKNYRRAIIDAVGEMNAWDKEVFLDALAMDTSIEPHKITSSISLMRNAGYPVDVVRREGRKIVSWKFRDQEKWSKKHVATPKAKGEAFKGTNYVTQAANAFKAGDAWDRLAAHEVDAVRGTKDSAVIRATTASEEDMELGRRVLMNYNSLPQKVKDSIQALKGVLPQPERGELEKVFVDLLGAKPVQDSDPSFWAVDEFADGSLMLARKDGTHWKASKL